jgi:hypothetical protein
MLKVFFADSETDYIYKRSGMLQDEKDLIYNVGINESRFSQEVFFLEKKKKYPDYFL